MFLTRFHLLSSQGYTRLSYPTTCALTSALLLCSCGSGNWNINIEGRDKTIVVPSTASVQPPYSSDGAPPPRRYVVRMSDGSLDWEVELPEVATGYELRIPFKDKRRGEANRGGVRFGDTEGLTEADKEIIATMRRRNLDTESEGVFDEQGRALDGRGTTARKSAEPAPARQSYIKGIEKARSLFESRKYEMALLALKELDRDYPNDLQIKSMLGTLWLQLNQPELARESWEAALKIDPQNKSLIQALRQLTPQLNEGDDSDGAE